MTYNYIYILMYFTQGLTQGRQIRMLLSPWPPLLRFLKLLYKNWLPLNMYQFTMGYPYQLHPGKIWSAAPDPKDIYLLLHALLWMHAINHNAVITCVLTLMCLIKGSTRLGLQRVFSHKNCLIWYQPIYQKEKFHPRQFY